MGKIWSFQFESCFCFFGNYFSKSHWFLITFRHVKFLSRMLHLIRFLCFFFLLVGFSNSLFSQSKKKTKLIKLAKENLKEWKNPYSDWGHLGPIEIDSLALNKKVVEIYFTKELSYVPIRENNYQQTIQSVKESLGEKFNKYDVRVITDGQYLETLIPNYFRQTIEKDVSRFTKEQAERTPVVRRINQTAPTKGIYNRNIALWHSHGWYYEAKLDRWEWQRARLYSTVEDIFPMTFVLPYLTPMLESAGANVFLPRERDTQIHEIIVDNDLSSSNSELRLTEIEAETVKDYGFLKYDTLSKGENPFQMGTHLRFQSSKQESQFLDYIPDFPEEGGYGVYVSYQQSDQNITDAKYSVTHTGGVTDFLLNQQIGGSSWIYLGKFRFEKGKNPKHGSVRLTSQSNEKGWITADAVKFGGGMGNVSRKPTAELISNHWSLKEGEIENVQATPKTNPDQLEWKTSQRPRYQEAARYYLQYAGTPESLVYSLNGGKNDYNDDYQSRGEWVNYLMGAPNGPNSNRTAEGLNIPIDLSLGFHTDAGVTPKDSIIGTLGIYSSVRDGGKFPNGQSKMINRDMTDMIQTEIVQDIRVQFKSDWSRRGLWNKQYSEAWRPNVPAMLLELLSHQNLADMSFGHDPRFKFAVSRSIYKGITKFLAFQNNTDYVIQPLPVDHFSINKINGKKITLSWKAVLDSLEPSAVPTKYKVYQRIGAYGFDNGKETEETFINIELDEFGELYSYKITALNEGGESFPSEVLSVGLLENKKKPVLVVNGFDRISAPQVFDYGDFAGLAHWDDEGVSDKYNIGYTGTQYDFDRNSPWLDDDSPGWGASYGDMEGKLIPGNSFDNTIIHGKAILEAGYSFVSSSDEAFSDPEFDLTPYETLDLILGEEKTTKAQSGELFKVFDWAIQKKITAFTQQGGNVLATGAYIASDYILNKDTVTRSFANNVLHYKWRTNHAVKSGEVHSTDYSNPLFNGQWVFNTSFHKTIYKVEAPDAIEPFGEGAITAFRYGENNSSAGIAFKGAYKTVIMGFPFETIIDEKGRAKLMKQILNYFDI